MPWVAVDVDDGIPWPVPPPMAVLNRARRHRLYPEALAGHKWLCPGGYKWYDFHVYCPDTLRMQHVNVLYVCTYTPVRQGDGFAMQKFYFSADYQWEWLHVRAAASACAWRFSDYIFHIHYA